MPKNIFRILVLIFMVASFDACQKDSENDPSVPDRDKFLGTWIAHSSGTSGELNFTMTIVAGASNANQIKISNFDAEGSGTSVLADVSGSSVSLTPTTIGQDNITGSGTYNSNNTLSFNYTINDGQTVDNRTATAHK
jgi:hypothetical protein